MGSRIRQFLRKSLGTSIKPQYFMANASIEKSTASAKTSCRLYKKIHAFMKKTIYLDHAAATQMDDSVLAAMLPYFGQKYYNPSATFLAAQGVSDDLKSARAEIASIVGVNPAEVYFTAGGTEANNLAIQGVMAQYPNANIVVSAIEHDSVLDSASKYDCRIAPVDENGQIDLVSFSALIDKDTVLVSVMYANNEIGSIQPLRAIRGIVDEKIRQRQLAGEASVPLYFHSDACQAAAYLDLHISSLGVDMLTLNGGKIYGPKQSGVLIVTNHIRLEPLILGGGQERGLRSGTENVAGCIGFSRALTLVQLRRKQESKRLLALRSLLADELSQVAPLAMINGDIKHRLPNNLNISFPGIDNERLMMELDEAGIMVAVGSACSASSDQPSHVLKAIGLSDDQARSSLRLTMGVDTSESQIQDVVKEISAILGRWFQK